MNKHGGIWLVIIGTFQMSPVQLLPIPSAHAMTEHLPSVHAETPPIIALCSHYRHALIHTHTLCISRTCFGRGVSEMQQSCSPNLTKYFKGRCINIDKM